MGTEQTDVVKMDDAQRLSLKHLHLQLDGNAPNPDELSVQ